MDTVFAALAPSKRSKQKLPAKLAQKQLEEGVDSLVRYLKREGGSVPYTGRASKFVKNTIKAAFLKQPTGADKIVRKAVDDGKIEIVLDETTGTRFIMRIT